MQQFNASLAKMILAIALFLSFQSCKKADAPETAAPAAAGNQTEALRNAVANSFGTALENVVYNNTEKQFEVEGDSHVSLQDAQLRFAHKGVASGTSAANHQEHFYLINETRVSNITIFADATVPALWMVALDSAIASWNRTACMVKMKRVSVRTGATTVVTTNYAVSSTIASAAYPDYYGNPGNKVTINTYQNSQTAAKKRFAITHELGHAIGLAHTNSTAGYRIEGTPTKDANSVMNATVLSWTNFTAGDLLAVRTLYPAS
jgi:hypothetical protein